jgi:hypothetical protein
MARAIQPIHGVSIEFFVRLYSFTLTQLTDWSFLYDILMKRLRRALKKTESRRCIIRYPIENGVAYYVAALSIDRFFDFATRFTDVFNSNEFIDMMDELYDAWEVAGLHIDYLSQRTRETVTNFQYRYEHEDDITTQSNMLYLEAHKYLTELAGEFWHGPDYPSIRHAYALEIADRILHDRQISGFIAEKLLALAPTKPDGYGGRDRKQFVYRVKWPAFVKPIIYSRDRGKCARCKVDIANELLAIAHIDHIHPLAFGGCNDVVNLQLSCDKCNREKATDTLDVESSVPNYHSRRVPLLTEQVLRPHRTPWWHRPGWKGD